MEFYWILLIFFRFCWSVTYNVIQVFYFFWRHQSTKTKVKYSVPLFSPEFSQILRMKFKGFFKGLKAFLMDFTRAYKWFAKSLANPSYSRMVNFPSQNTLCCTGIKIPRVFPEFSQNLSSLRGFQGLKDEMCRFKDFSRPFQARRIGAVSPLSCSLTVLYLLCHPGVQQR